MKKFKKMMAMALTFVTAVTCLALPAGAVDMLVNEEASFEELQCSQTNEYDTYVELKGLSDEELELQQFSVEDIQSIRSNTVEAALYERAQLPTEELVKYGYTYDEIEILKSYDGTNLEDHPEMRAVMSTFTATLTKISSNESGSRVRYGWLWNRIPTACLPLVKDIVVIAWKATNCDNITCNMREIDSWGKVSYYEQQTLSYEKNLDIDVNTMQDSVEARVIQNDGSGKWAKSGYIILETQEQVIVNNMAITNYAAGFGHVTGNLNGGIGVDFSGVTPGLDFKLAVTKADSRDLRITH